MHEIDTMAYAGATPWHGLGTYVGDQPLADAAAMVEAAGLDWAVEGRPLFTCSAPKSEGGVLINVGSHKAIIRTDRNETLGVVGKGYEPIQNADLFGVLDSLTADGSMRYHTAGSLANGQRVWALGKIGEHETVPGDRSDHFILAFSTHDGSGAFQLVWTTTRVVCANTAAVALRGAKGVKRRLSLRHTKNVASRFASAKEALGIAQKAMDAHVLFESALAQASMNHALWTQFARKLIPDPKPAQDAQSLMDEVSVSTARAQAKRDLLEELFHHGIGQDIPGVSGTLYAARNAVTQYVNYERQTKGTGAEGQENRFMSSLWGSGAAMVEQADGLLYEMLDAA